MATHIYIFFFLIQTLVAEPFIVLIPALARTFEVAAEYRPCWRQTQATYMYSAFHLLLPWLENDFILSFKTSYYFFLFWTLIAELVIDSISVLARTCPRLAGEDSSHRREYCWRHNHAVAHAYEVGTKKSILVLLHRRFRLNWK